MKKTFTTASGLSATLTIPAPHDGPSIFVVAGHKTGSVLLNKIIDDIAAETALPAIPVEVAVWREGFAIADWPADLYAFLETPGYVFHSFRWLQKLPELDAFGTARKIFMLRDPRDIAVSYYYSMAKSHSIPKTGATRDTLLELRETAGQMDIDAFIQADKAGPVLRNTARFAGYYGRADCVFYRYEDIIFDKRPWVARIARDLGVDLSPAVCDRIADRHDLRPETENPDAHVRNVTPGNYRQKLSAESVVYIERTHPAFFDTLGYARSAG